MKTAMALPMRERVVQEIDHEEAGEMVREIRRAAGVSLRGLAKKLGISAAYLSDLERGRRNWTEERFNQAMKFL